MRILITGGRGFIGSRVARWALQQGHEVIIADRSGAFGVDIVLDTDEQLDNAFAGADAVIHLAGMLGTAELFDQVGAAIETNILGSWRVADWCSRHGANYVNILMPDVFPSIYAATKHSAKRITDAMHTAGRLRCSHVIAYNAHGPGQAYGFGHPRKYAPTFSVAAWNGQPIPIWGDGTALLDPVPVDTVARMLVDACRFDDNQVFDGGTGFAVSVQEVAEYVLEVTGSKAGIVYESMRVGESPTNAAATGLGWDLLDWRPGTEDWRGLLRETIWSYRHYEFDPRVAPFASVDWEIPESTA